MLYNYRRRLLNDMSASYRALDREDSPTHINTAPTLIGAVLIPGLNREMLSYLTRQDLANLRSLNKETAKSDLLNVSQIINEIDLHIKQLKKKQLCHILTYSFFIVCLFSYFIFAIRNFTLSQDAGVKRNHERYTALWNSTDSCNTTASCYSVYGDYGVRNGMTFCNTWDSVSNRLFCNTTQGKDNFCTDALLQACFASLGGVGGGIALWFASLIGLGLLGGCIYVKCKTGLTVAKLSQRKKDFIRTSLIKYNLMPGGNDDANFEQLQLPNVLEKFSIFRQRLSKESPFDNAPSDNLEVVVDDEENSVPFR